MGVCNASAHVFVCTFFCVYVSEERAVRSPAVDLSLAAGQGNCVAASLYSSNAERGLQSTHNTPKPGKLTHIHSVCHTHSHTQTHANLANGMNSLHYFPPSFAHLHHSLSSFTRIYYHLSMLASTYAHRYMHAHTLSHLDLLVISIFKHHKQNVWLLCEMWSENSPLMLVSVPVNTHH